MDFKRISNQYRPIPFWSWNTRLSAEETSRQVYKMYEAGMGGFFMHARGGLQTEYMGEEWFDNVEAAISKAEALEMYPWAYDENGWPSGFGNGLINGLGPEYQQKYLRMEKERSHEETSICQCGNHWFYYDVNPFYIDTLDKKVIQAFIEKIYQPYYERYQGRLAGFFTDEPQISRNGIPWSFVFEEEYKSRYGEDIKERLEELFIDQDDYVTTRLRFWKMVTELFSSAYMKQIYEWCHERGLKLTGHLLMEESLLSQLTTNGACMPHYEYFHIPGMDWLGRNIFDCLTAKQVSSVAEQLGKEQVISESFALCGHNVSFDELKGIYEWQMVRGINLLCQHLEGYSIGGMRKRDYPPALFIQQPWWKDYKYFIEAMAREGMILATGEKDCSVLLLHPQSKAWTLFHDQNNEKILQLNQKFLDAITILEKKHVAFHLGDEMIMERHGYVEDGCIVIGSCRYNRVCLVQDEVLFDSTRRLLERYQAQGGKVVAADEIEEVRVTDSDKISYTVRRFRDCRVHFFVNSNNEYVRTKIFVNGKRLDALTAERREFDGIHTFEPYGSLLIVEEPRPNHPCQDIPPFDVMRRVNDSSTVETVTLEEEMVIEACTPNAVTLDKCDYYFDGILQEKNGYVLNITERANRLGRPVEIHQDYLFTVKEIPETISLVCETPEKFNIKINGRKISTYPENYFIDYSFRCIDISDDIRIGENVISFEYHFEQSEKVYEHIKRAAAFEGERNRLSYDMEIEAIYLIGNFGVNTPGTWTEEPRNAERYEGGFEIDKFPLKRCPANLHKSGFPFFAGTITFSGNIFVKEEHAVLKLRRQGVNVVKIKIGETEKTFLWNGDEIDLTGWVKHGRNEIRISLTNNLRNLLGPHHLEEGESYAVRPKSFFREPCPWNDEGAKNWNDNYCFVKFGI